MNTVICIERVIYLERGGNLGKSGPGPRAKADPARNFRKNGSGIFANGFTPQRQYCSYHYCSYHSNRPMSCRNNVKLKDGPFNQDQNRGGQDQTSSKQFQLGKKKTYSEIMRKLDKQSNRKNVKLDIDKKTYTIKNPDRVGAYELQDKLAEQLYDSIRTSDTDVCDIAKNTKFKADNIKKCKDHVFYNEQTLDKFKDQEVKTERKRFDPDLKQALAWQRLEAGVHNDQDIEWLKHECAESHHELKYGAGYSESHKGAQKGYDGSPSPDWDN